MIKNLWLIIGCINSIAMAENIPEPGLATPAYTQPTITYSQPIYTQPTQSYYTTQTTNYTTPRYRYPMVTSQLGYPNYQTINFNYGTRYLRRR